jgi:2-keto-3-deoxy-L-rhamnonate aldolase RhmA
MAGRPEWRVHDTLERLHDAVSRSPFELVRRRAEDLGDDPVSEAKASTFRQRLVNRDLLVGTWIKTPSPIVCEVLGKSGLDALCLDTEHAPFGRLELDACISTCRAVGMTALVRVPSADSPHIQSALDCGATGVVVPHVKTAEEAEAICLMSLYGPGGRGYAGSTRAARFGGKAIADHLGASADETTIIAQIEDLEALNAIEDIAAVERVDCLFIGRLDLTVALGKRDPSEPAVVDAVERICAAGRSAEKAVGMFVSNVEEAKHWTEKGASLFLLASDHAFLLAGARTIVSALRS